jgi:hypothetical protein
LSGAEITSHHCKPEFNPCDKQWLYANLLTQYEERDHIGWKAIIEDKALSLPLWAMRAKLST